MGRSGAGFDTFVVLGVGRCLRAKSRRRLKRGPAQILQLAGAVAGHGEAAAGSVQVGPDQAQTADLAGEPAGDLHAASGLSHGPLDDVAVSDPAVVLAGEPQVACERPRRASAAFEPDPNPNSDIQSPALRRHSASHRARRRQDPTRRPVSLQPSHTHATRSANLLASRGNPDRHRRRWGGLGGGVRTGSQGVGAGRCLNPDRVAGRRCGGRL